MSARDPLIETLERDEQRHRTRLIEQARHLSDDLRHFADQLERNPGRTVVNELGEVQSQGSKIDARCGAYVATTKALKAARGLAAASSSQDKSTREDVNAKFRQEEENEI